MREKVRIGLTKKQQDFCEAYIESGMDSYAVARKFGYAQPNVWKYLRNEDVKQYLKKIQKMVDKKMAYSFEKKLDELKRFVQLCVPENATYHKDCDIKAAVQCIQEMNRMQGHHSAQKIDLYNLKDKDLEEGNKITEESKQEIARALAQEARNDDYDDNDDTA